MSKFITLTDAQDGTRRRINADSIAQYFASGYTMVLSESGSFDALETPEQIDAMLGVTETPTTDDRAARLLAFCGEFISAQRITCPETIAQCDRVIVAAYEFIEGVCDIAGYDARED
ncbi:hypothetical protein J2847_004081 [Azospirillum agricola]|uniref:hypothetical protein n=1 Tax=Azospirillum agricola TaxID=1720247 RepID=UPI001AE1EEAD|nr:hypothetical protein [Azospirillum agricola]MBP2230772.1 hypothetical protein [Azospirillum agricola]